MKKLRELINTADANVLFVAIIMERLTLSGNCTKKEVLKIDSVILFSSY